MSRRRGCWAILGIESTRDAREIRRAYAAKLKLTHPEDDPEGFQQLRAAYEAALQYSAAAPQVVVELPGAANEDEAEDELPDEEGPAPITGLEITPVHEPAPVELDRDLLAQQSAIAAIAEALHDRRPIDGPRAQKLLEAVLDPGRLERFDLYQMTETALCELLSRSIPRSDPFLVAVEQQFEWARRQNDRHLDRGARAIVSRLSDLWYLSHLQNSPREEGWAFRRLTLPVKPFARWRHAYLNLKGSWPEVELLGKLENEHPRLLKELRKENVEWWRRFVNQPRFSNSTMLLGMLVSLIAVLSIFDDRSAKVSALPLVPVGGLAIAFFRLYAIDWPVHLAQERWRARPPAWFSVGWLPAGIVLLFGALLAANFAWLGWAVAALAWVVAWWGVLAGGPGMPVVVAGSIRPLNSRVGRAVTVNFIALVWLFLGMSDVPSGFSWPLLWTIFGVMFASAMGRMPQIRAFAQLGARTRTLACFGGATLAVLLGYLSIRYGMQPGWATALFIAVLSLVLLRRAAPMDLQLPNFSYRILGVAAIIGINVVRVLRDVDMTPGTKAPAGDGTLVVGNIIMLLGVLAATLQYAWLLHRSQRE